MKKTIKRALALMLMLCIMLPQTAQAAVTYYVEVSISDETGKAVTGESSHYATRQEPLAAAVVGIIADKYEELETVFLTATDDKMYLSSSLVKQVAAYGEDVSKFVPECILQDITEKFGKDG